MIRPVGSLFGDLGGLCQTVGDFLVGGNVVAHLAVVEPLVGVHIEVAGAGQAEDDGLFLAGFLALQGLIDGDPNGVAAFGGGQDALDAGEYENFYRYYREILGERSES